MKYRKKPVVIEALMWTGHNLDEITRLCGEEPEDMKLHRIGINTLEGRMLAHPGDYIIRGVQGECYPCKRDIFEQTYEPVD